MALASLSLLTLLLGADLPDPARLPAHPALPDPLVALDGTRIKTAEEWQRLRRPQLKQLFQHYMYGYLPAARKVEAKVLHEDARAFGGKATLREIEVRVAPLPAPPIYLLLVVPNARSGPAPVFLGMNFSGNHALVDDPKVRLPDTWMYPGRNGVKDNRATAEGRGSARDVWAIDQAIARGYAVATFYNGDVDPDRKEKRGGLRPFIDPDEKSATIAFWAWGIHRVLDYLLTRDDIDPKRVAVVGHSRLGKTALVAAAFDDRIALAIPHQAGCGGTAPSRGKVGESVTRINTAFPHWFNANFKKFNDRTECLPFDQNALVALVAPRPVLFSNSVKDIWANPDGQFEVLKAAEPVYKFLGAPGLEAPTPPPIGKLAAGRLGYFIRPGEHSMTRGDWKAFLDFADRHLGKPGGRSAAPKKLLLIGQGPDGHPPQTHEYMAGLRVLAACLARVPGLQVTTVQADGRWTEGPELIDRADGVVLFASEGAAWIGKDRARLEAFRRLAKRGGGRVTLHWAMGTREAGPIADYLALFGGCHGGPDRKYKVLTTKVAVKPHPVTAGLTGFTIKDEFYYRLKFPTPQPASLLEVDIDGETQTVAWAAEGQGRTFGFSGLHFHANWSRAEYRRLVAQGTLWTLGLPLPAGGLDVAVDENVLRLGAVHPSAAPLRAAASRADQ
ncbi:MAG: ThuA domain-containing protein [Gemmataceae bacterium]